MHVMILREKIFCWSLLVHRGIRGRLLCYVGCRGWGTSRRITEVDRGCASFNHEGMVHLSILFVDWCHGWGTSQTSTGVDRGMCLWWSWEDGPFDFIDLFNFWYCVELCSVHIRCVKGPRKYKKFKWDISYWWICIL